MKKLVAVAVVAVLAGFASSAFAQGSPSVDARTMGMAWSGSAPKVDSKQIANNSLISKIRTKGVKAALTYTLNWSPCVIGTYSPTLVCAAKDTKYPAQGTFSGYVYKAEANKVLILMDREDWNHLTDEYPSFMRHPVLNSHTFTTKAGETYVQSGPDKLDKDHYTIGQNKYTVVTVNLEKKK